MKLTERPIPKVAEKFYTNKFANGLTLLALPMEHVSSAAISISTPAGSSRDPADRAGAAYIATEWMMRGAGAMNSRQLNDALDSLGCQHGISASSDNLAMSAAMLGKNLPAAIAILADIIRRPTLADETFDSCRELAQQDLESLEDEPAQKANLLLREQYYPFPLARCAYGSEQSLAAMAGEDVRAHLRRNCTPQDTIIAAAGKFDWDDLLAIIEKFFGDWQGAAPEAVTTSAPAGGVRFIKKDCAQTHIAMGHRTVTPSHGQYYHARVAEAVLSSGMSSRLFTEVREKRGLVYHVSCRYGTLKQQAGMFTYAGTRPELAQQTLDVTVAEIRRLAQGATAEELKRAKTQLKSSMIMSGESTSARAGSMVTDWYHLGRLRTLEEVAAKIDAVTADDVLKYLQDFPADDFTVTVIGPTELNTAIIRS